MKKCYCDICGNDIGNPGIPGSRPELMETKKSFLESHRKGKFAFEYQQPVVNKDGDIIHFSYSSNVQFCPDCIARIEKAMWNEVEKMTAENLGKQKMDIMVLPKFPPMPIVEESSTPVMACGDTYSSTPF